jgi:hypothetical protein
MGKGNSSPEYMKAWREKNREKIKGQKREWTKKNRKHVNNYNRNYIQSHPKLLEKRKSFNREYYRTHKKNWKIRKNSTKKLREKIFEILGNKCVHCGFSDNRILQIDHVKGNGLRQRKQEKSYFQMLKTILKELECGSKDYQCLCPNCNWIKRIENKEENNR